MHPEKGKFTQPPIQQVCTEHPLCAGRCARRRGDREDQTKTPRGTAIPHATDFCTDEKQANVQINAAMKVIGTRESKQDDGTHSRRGFGECGLGRPLRRGHSRSALEVEREPVTQRAGERGIQIEETATVNGPGVGMSSVCGRNRRRLGCRSGAGGRVEGGQAQQTPGPSQSKEMPGKDLWEP